MRGMSSQDASVIEFRVTNDDVRLAKLGSCSRHKHNMAKTSTIDKPFIGYGAQAPIIHVPVVPG